MKKIGMLLLSIMCITSCNNTTSTTSNTSSNKVSSDVSNSSSIIASTSSSEVNQNSCVNSSSVNSTSSSSLETYSVAVYDIENKNTFVNFENNKSEQENKEDEFIDLTRNYQVGDDNSFDFKPNLTLYRRNNATGERDFVYNADWEYEVSLEEYSEEGFSLASTSEFVDSLDSNNCVIDFNDAAVGKTFKISLYPKNLSSDQMKDLDTKWTRTYVVDVIDGYNVTETKELAYIHNHDGNMVQIGSLPRDNYKTIWDEFKTANGLTLEYSPASLVFHNDIVLTKEDVPAKLFYSEEEVSESDSDYSRVIGSLKDYISIYHRDLEENEEFKIEGNYFSLDIDNFPTIVRADNKITDPDHIISHSQLFRFEGDETAIAKIDNIKLIGNSPREEDSTLSGGLIMNKVEGPRFSAYNNIAIRWFITYFPQTVANYTMDSCRAYNNFNSFIFSWGGVDVVIKNSEMKGAGGPAIIQNHLGCEDSDPANDVICSTKIINSTLESIVAGTEGWFSIMNATSIVPSIKALDLVFNVGGRSFLRKGGSGETYLNVICLNKSGEAESVTTNPNVRGSVSVKNDTTDYTFDYGATNPYFGAMYQAVLAQNASAPLFETSGGGMAYTDGATGLYDIQNNNITTSGDTSNAIYKGEYLCMYYSGMQMLFSYGNFEA